VPVVAVLVVEAAVSMVVEEVSMVVAADAGEAGFVA
jgi:hypothetical protein